jgi:pentapeptide repeat protein
MIKFDVPNRWSGQIQFTAEIDCQEDAPRSIKLGLAIKWARKSGADLADANLAGADLARADLARADLTGADLARAYLTGADLAGAYLADAIKELLDVPVIPNIDATILAAIEAGGRLDMSSWHGDSPCGTTHCRAGWAVHLAGEAGAQLESKVGTQRAGAMIYRASRPCQPAPWFFDTTENALADIRKCAAEQLDAASKTGTSEQP